MKWSGQQWGEQLAREAQQMREQVERDRQQIRERSRQGRKEQAESYLEGRTADLLGQAHARAHYGACQASMFPLPSARPARQGGRPRSDSPPPLNDAWIRRAEAKLRIGDHNNTIRTSVRRMLRDGCGLSQRTAQNLGDSAEYAVDAAVAYFLGGLSKVGKAAGFAGQVIKAAKKVTGRIHKNSNAYEGETHQYVIRGPDGKSYKIGESARGVRKRDKNDP